MNLVVSNNTVSAATTTSATRTISDAVTTSGGIMTSEAIKKQKIFDTFCYNESEIERQMEEDLNDLKFSFMKDEAQEGLNVAKLDKLKKVTKHLLGRQKKKIKQKWAKIRGMTLKELDENGYIKKLCKKYEMPKIWFDRISMTESTYGVYTPGDSYNAWGWGIYGDKITKIDDNWYDASSYFIQEFMKSYGANPTVEDMLRYCPSGAYNKFFSSADQAKAKRIMAANKAKEKAKKEKEKAQKEKKKKLTEKRKKAKVKKEREKKKRLEQQKKEEEKKKQDEKMENKKENIVSV